jgi:hypothetical protein
MNIQLIKNCQKDYEVIIERLKYIDTLPYEEGLLKSLGDYLSNEEYVKLQKSLQKVVDLSYKALEIIEFTTRLEVKQEKYLKR